MRAGKMIVASFVTLFVSSFASAAVTHFSSSMSFVQADSTEYSMDSTYFQKVFDPNGGPVATQRSLLAPEGTASGQAQGALSTGALKAYASSSASGVENLIAGFSRIDLGDSFRAVTGSGPFTWSSRDVATFKLNLSGQVQRAGTGARYNNSQVGLTILQPGALDAYARWVDGDNSAFGEWNSRVLTQRFYDLDSDEPVGLANVRSFPISIPIQFYPGGDFDWVATLIADTQVYGDFASANAAVTANFLNTAQLEYIGPEGTTTVSASGVFPGTSSVPEPAYTAVLVLLSLGMLRRRLPSV